MSGIFPWQESQWQLIQKRFHTRTIPHSLLLSGPKGLGKTHFANSLARLLLCEQALINFSFACGQCKQCLWLEAGTHPNYTIISPEEEGKLIKIEQIREIIEQLNKTSQDGNYKVVILEPIEAMNIAAANALLKTLEEPAGKVCFILISHRLFSVPATIRSRCQTINFNIPSTSVASHWIQQQIQITDNELEILLVLTDNIPLQALNLIKNDSIKQYESLIKAILENTPKKLSLTQLANFFQGIEITNILNIFMLIIMELIRFHANQPIKLLNRYLKPQLLSSKIDTLNIFELYHLLDKIYNAKRLACSKVNLNNQLLLEDLIIDWQKCISLS